MVAVFGVTAILSQPGRSFPHWLASKVTRPPRKPKRGEGHARVQHEEALQVFRLIDTPQCMFHPAARAGMEDYLLQLPGFVGLYLGLLASYWMLSWRLPRSDTHC